MKEEPKKRQEEVALFRYGLIAEATRLPPGSEGIAELFERYALQAHQIPGSARTRVAPETMRDWLKAWRKGGFEALLPRARADQGSSHALPQAVADLLVGLKEDKPELSVQVLIREARRSGRVPAELPLAPSTVHRLFARKGLMQKDRAAPTDKDRRRFEFPKAGDLWMSDVMHGPAVGVGGKVKRKAYLIALLDDCTRVVPHAAFTLSENTASYLPVFKQAVLRRGLPRRLLVDNGAAYRSHHLAMVCARLDVALIHARPYQPQSKGKQERWFRTVRMQLLPLLTAQELSSLESLNRRLWAWVEGEYHHAPHRGLDGDTPLDRWASTADQVRYLGPRTDLDDLFLFEQKRKVARDRTVSLLGVTYEVDAALVGRLVTLRFDPSAPGRPIQVWDQGARTEARVVDVHANAYARRNNAPAQTAEAAPRLRFSDLADEEG